MTSNNIWRLASCPHFYAQTLPPHYSHAEPKREIKSTQTGFFLFRRMRADCMFTYPRNLNILSMWYLGRKSPLGDATLNRAHLICSSRYLICETKQLSLNTVRRRGRPRVPNFERLAAETQVATVQPRSLGIHQLNVRDVFH